ncbi:MAG: gamma-glutamylcyclotransferase family protein, partial [Metallosphaera sp.]
RYGFPLSSLLLRNNSSYIGLGYITGYKMVDIGEYPGIIKSEGDNVVWGEVYRVSNETLRLLDEVEEYHDSPDDLYKREAVKVYFDSKRRYSLSAYAYIYAKSYFLKYIEVGDYTEYKNGPALLNFFDIDNYFVKNRYIIVDRIEAFLESSKGILKGTLYRISSNLNFYRIIKNFILLGKSSYNLSILKVFDRLKNEYFALSFL